MKRTVTGLMLALGLCLTNTWSAWALEKPIYILHTNDIHCGVDDNIGLAKVVAYRNELKKQSPHVVLVDAGDAVQGTPLGTMSNGQAVMNVLNAVGYDFMVPGNHEFDFGMPALLKLDKQSNCGYYCANLIELATRKPLFPAYKMMTFEDVKVAFVGACTPNSFTSSTPKYFQNAEGQWLYDFCNDDSGKKLYRQLQKNVNAAHKEGAKYVFLVGHLGIHSLPTKWSSPVVAKKLKGITGVIDGHSHETANRYELGKTGRIISQTGTKLNNLGVIKINPDESIEMKMENRYTMHLKPDEKIASVITKEREILKPLLMEKIGETKAGLYINDPKTKKRIVRNNNSNMADFATDAFRYATGAEVFVTNGGSLRSNINKGYINLNNVLETIPFGNMVCTAWVTGQQLLDCLEMGARKYPYENGGFMQISGGSYTVDCNITSSVEIDKNGSFVGVKGPYRVSEVKINNKPLELNKKYLVGGSAYTLKNGGDGMTMFKGVEIVQDETLSDFDCFRQYISQALKGVIGENYANPYGEGRIKFIK